MTDLSTVAACAFFTFVQGDPAATFVFQTCEPTVIQQARTLLKSAAPGSMHPAGKVVRGTVPYNPDWGYHLDPATVSFAEMSIEVCDADMGYVEEHLDEVGGAFLPGARWCPWNAVLTGEVTPPATNPSG